MRKLFLICFLSLTACGGQLRKPFCPTYLPTFPPEFNGVYEVVMPFRSVEWSGNTLLKSMNLAVNDKVLSSSQPVPGMPDWGAFCKVGSRYFIEQRNSNGTFSFTEVLPFAQGLILSVMALDLDQIRSKGYKLHYFPDFSAALQGNQPSMSLSLTPTFTLDNSNLTTEQILAVSKPLSLQLVLRSVPPAVAEKYTPRVRVRLTEKGIRKF